MRAFVGLTFALSVPFWAVGAASGAMFGGGLPIASAMVVCPAGAASILVYRQAGRQGLTRLWKRVLDRAGLTATTSLVVALGVVPAAVAVTAGIDGLLGRTTPDASTPWALVPLAFAAFAAAAVVEEVGWSGYAADELLPRRSPLTVGVVLGGVWAVWHYVPLVQAGHSVTWIAWWTLFTVALRVILVMLYDRAGRSVPIAVFGHAASNVATVSFGDFFDPRITGVVLAAEALGIFLLHRRHAHRPRSISSPDVCVIWGQPARDRSWSSTWSREGRP